MKNRDITTYVIEDTDKWMFVSKIKTYLNSIKETHFILSGNTMVNNQTYIGIYVLQEKSKSWKNYYE